MKRSCLPPLALAAVLACWPATSAAQAAPGLRMTASEAVARALRSNLDLAYEKLAPDLSDAPLRAAEAAYDLMLSSQLEVSGSPGQVSAERAGLSPVSSTDVSGGIGLRREISTGTSVELGFSSSALSGGGARAGLDPAYQSALLLSARQSLLNGISRAANLLPLTSARLTRSIATKNLARTAELVGAATLRAYWDLHAALSKLKIQDLAVRMSEKTLAETEALIAAGKLPASERVSAAYAVQAQQRDRLLIEQQVADGRDKLARLIGLVPPGSRATPPIVTVIGSRPRRWATDREQLQQLALKRRGDYLGLLEQVKLHRAEVAATGHRRLPKLDLVAGLSLSGLSGTSTDGQSDYPSGYWSSYELRKVGWSAGLVLDVPLFNHKAKADAEAAAIKLHRAEVAVDRAVQALAEELNVAWRGVEMARRELALTKVAVKTAETKLADEEHRYKAGLITAHILATVQAEVLKERLAKEQALANLISARVGLYAAGGVLLQRVEQLQRRR